MNRQRVYRAAAVVFVTLLLLLLGNRAEAAYRLRPLPLRLAEVAVATTQLASGDFQIEWDGARA